MPASGFASAGSGPPAEFARTAQLYKTCELTPEERSVFAVP
jgi:hypothetical protein